jgi:hypothetical protein
MLEALEALDDEDEEDDLVLGNRRCGIALSSCDAVTQREKLQFKIEKVMNRISLDAGAAGETML